MAAIAVGDKFPDYKSLATALQRYQDEKKVVLIKQDSKTVEVANRRIKKTDELFPTTAKYAYVHFACKHFGKRKTNSTGIRPNQATFKTGCRAGIHIALEKSSGCYVVRSLQEQHNHDLSAATFRHYPENRRLTESEKEKITSLMALDVSVTKIWQQFNSNHRALTRKDLHNLKQHVRSEAGDEEQQILQHLEELLETDPGATIRLEIKENGQLHMIFVQTSVMKDYAKRFPELLVVDGTYRVNRRQFPLYSVMVKDGNGNGQAIAQALLVDEKRPTLESFFSQVHKSVEFSVKTVLVDKDFNEITVLQKLWPDAEVLLCRFHVLKALRQNITSTNMPTSVAETVKTVLQRLVYAHTEGTYKECRKSLQEVAPETYWNYFVSNWDSCKEKWAYYITKTTQNYDTLTTNFVESRHNVLKHTLKPLDSLAECLKKVISCQLGQEAAALQKNHDHNLKQHYRVGETGPLKQQIRALLTPLAAQLTVRELDSSLRATRWTCEEKGDVVDVITDSGVYTVSNRVTPDGNVPSCSCSFSASQLLPCRHIFKVASRCWDVEFCDTWVPKRWQLSYQMPQAPKISRSVTVASAACPPSSGPLGKREKFRQVFSLLKLMADACADCGQREFLARYELLQQLQTLWSEGKTAALAELVDAPDVQPDHPAEERPVAQDGLPPVKERLAVIQSADPAPAEERPVAQDGLPPVEERLTVIQSTDPAPAEERPVAQDGLPPVEERLTVIQSTDPAPAKERPVAQDGLPPVEERLTVIQSTDPAPAAECPVAQDGLPPVEERLTVIQSTDPAPAEERPVAQDGLPPVEERLTVIQSTDPAPAEERPVAQDGLPPVEERFAVIQSTNPAPAEECPVAQDGLPPVEERLTVIQSTDPAPAEECPVAQDGLPPVEERLTVIQSTDPAPAEERPVAQDGLPPVEERITVIQSTDPAPAEERPVAQDGLPPVEERFAVIQSTNPAPAEEHPVAQDGLPPVEERPVTEDWPHAVQPGDTCDGTSSTGPQSLVDLLLAAGCMPADVSSGSIHVTELDVGCLPVPLDFADPLDGLLHPVDNCLVPPDLCSVVEGNSCDPVLETLPDVLAPPTGFCKEDRSSHLAMSPVQLQSRRRLEVSFKLPPVAAPRGRPKGALLNAIGLPYTRKRQAKRKPASHCETKAAKKRKKQSECDNGLSTSSKKRKIPDATRSWQKRSKFIQDLHLSSPAVAYLVREAHRYPMPVTNIRSMVLNNTNPSVALYREAIELDGRQFEACFEQVMACIGQHPRSSTREGGARRSNIMMLVTALFMRAAQLGLTHEEIIQTLEPVPLQTELTLDMLSVKVPKNTTQLVVGRFSIGKSSLLALQDNNKVDDEVIHAYLHLLTRDLPDVMVLPSFVMVMMAEGVRDASIFHYPEVKMSEKRLLLMPVHSNDHWVLLVAQPKQGTVWLLDSVDSLLSKQREEKYLQLWREFMCQRSEATGEDLRDWQFGAGTSTQQTDSVNCGIFVLMNADATIKGKSCQLFRSCHVAPYRKLVLHSLLKYGRRNKEDVCSMPYCRRPSGKAINWIQCDRCDRWFHRLCLGVELDASSEFQCPRCPMTV